MNHARMTHITIVNSLYIYIYVCVYVTYIYIYSTFYSYINYIYIFTSVLRSFRGEGVYKFAVSVCESALLLT